MGPAAARLECLRVAAGLRVTQGTHLPSNLVPGIIADARAFAAFVLGDDEPVDEPLRPDIEAVISGRFPSFTGGFRDGPASEP